MVVKECNYFELQFGVDGVPTTTHYLTPGKNASQVAAMLVPLPRACQLNNIDVIARVAPGAGVTDTFTVYKNGVATTAIANVVTTALTGSWSGTPVTFAADDTVSLYFTSAGGATAIDDVGITLRFLIEM